MTDDTTLRADAGWDRGALLERVLAGVSDQFFVLDRDWRYVYVNDRVARTIGTAREQLLGRSIWDLFPDLVGTDFDRAARRAVAEQQPVQFDFHYPVWDRWFENRLYPAADTLTVLATEVTSRKQAEEALRESEVIFRTLGEALPDFLWMADAKGRPVYQNPAWHAYTGLTTADLARHGWQVLPHPDDLPRLQAVWDEATRHGTPFVVEYRCRRHDGEYRWFLSRTVPVKDEAGRVVRWVGTTTDIHDHMRLEEALRAGEERFRTMANTTPAIIWTADPTGAITFHNQRWLDYTGISPQDNVRDWPTRVLHPDDLERCTAAWTRALEQGAEYEIEVRNRRRDGVYRWFLTRATPIRDAAGRVVEWYGSTTDIHDRKQAEEILRDDGRRKDEFLATLAHELRNPLAPLRNALNILRLDGVGGGPSAGVHEMMERQLNHLVRLVDDLLEVSRITRGKIELRKEPVELAAVIGSAVETSRPLIEAGRHSLTVQLPPEPLILEGDPVRLAQVFANLLNNAAKYTEPGGRIWLTASATAHEVAVSVRDTGIGLAADMLPRVFDMFTQVDRSVSRAQGGLGIGLALVRSLVQLHGGGVEATSAGPGRGSEFLVRLPHVSRPRPRPPGPAAAPTALPPQRVLIVDDNRDAAVSLGMLLKRMGAGVQTVHDGPAALSALTAFRPDVVLLDLGMPGMDGYEVARRLRGRDEGRAVTLIALTGWGQEDDRRRTLEAGFDHHLVKPVDLDALRTLLTAPPAERSPD